jgi:hypothetical protein
VLIQWLCIFLMKVLMHISFHFTVFQDQSFMVFVKKPGIILLHWIGTAGLCLKKWGGIDRPRWLSTISKGDGIPIFSCDLSLLFMSGELTLGK